MATAGPELPPHLLAKRKRQEEAREEEQPQPPTQESHPRPSSSFPTSSTTDDSNKRRRTIGPAPPPAPLAEKPTEEPSPNPPPQTKTPNPNPDSDSEDDDFGPSLPPLQSTSQTHPPSPPHAPTNAQSEPTKPRREEWMLIPPTPDSWTTRLDPTKLRNRKFASSKSSAAKTSHSNSNNGEVSTIWTETPEQKRERLRDEVMGVRQPAALAGRGGEGGAGMGGKERERVENEKRIREFVERERGGALYDVHASRKKGRAPAEEGDGEGGQGNGEGEGREKEDDPSKRAFDKEKDMGGGVKIGHKQRREMLGRAKEFGGRFEGGKFL